jgi:hypothetical protein
MLQRKFNEGKNGVFNKCWENMSINLNSTPYTKIVSKAL